MAITDLQLSCQMQDVADDIIADIGPSALAKLYFVPRTDGNSSASLNPLAHGWHRRFSSNAANFSI